MCSEAEILQRGTVEISSMSRFEKLSDGSNFDNMAIKVYNRSAADKVMNDPDNIRPP
jgi:hypothetical protein